VDVTGSIPEAIPFSGLWSDRKPIGVRQRRRARIAPQYVLYRDSYVYVKPKERKAVFAALAHPLIPECLLAFDPADYYNRGLLSQFLMGEVPINYVRRTGAGAE